MIFKSLEGKAYQWQQHYMQSQGNEFISWKIFMQDLVRRFNKGGFKDPLTELTNLKQTRDLEEYMENFDDLVARAGHSDAQSISCFLGGLKALSEKFVRLSKPQSLSEAMNLVVLQ